MREDEAEPAEQHRESERAEQWMNKAFQVNALTNENSQLRAKLEHAERALVKQHTRAEQIETNLRAWVRVAQFDASDEELLERAHNAFRNLTETADDDGGCEHQDEFLCSACERRMFVLTLLPVLVKVRKEQAALREG